MYPRLKIPKVRTWNSLSVLIHLHLNLIFSCVIHCWLLKSRDCWYKTGKRKKKKWIPSFNLCSEFSYFYLFLIFLNFPLWQIFDFYIFEYAFFLKKDFIFKLYFFFSFRKCSDYFFCFLVTSFNLYFILSFIRIFFLIHCFLCLQRSLSCP